MEKTVSPDKQCLNLEKGFNTEAFPLLAVMCRTFGYWGFAEVLNNAISPGLRHFQGSGTLSFHIKIVLGRQRWLGTLGYVFTSFSYTLYNTSQELHSGFDSTVSFIRHLYQVHFLMAWFL